MKISVRVRTNARKNIVEDCGGGNYIVHVTAPPVEGKANERVVELLSEFFKKPKRSIVIIRGASSRQKLVEVPDLTP